MIVFCANALPTVLAAQGLRQFQPLISTLNPRLIINQCGGDIEARSSYFAKKIQQFDKPIHLIGYGVAGLDLRYALSLKNNQNILSLITIGTPHRGSILAHRYNLQLVEDDIIEPLSRILGIRNTYFQELNPDNIRDFNLVAINQEKINYYNINAETVIGNMSEIYHASGAIIEKYKEYPVDSGSDGVFAHNETKWGNHVATLDCDHGSLIGTPVKRNGEQTVNIIQQLIQQ